jgi:hypothetical protein
MRGLKPFVIFPIVVVALALVLAIAVPGAGPIVDTGAAVFAALTWLIPPLSFALQWYREPRGSLGKAGAAIAMIVFTMCASATGLLLVLTAFLVVPDRRWAWLSLLAIVAFWLAVAVVGGVYGRRQRARRQGDGTLPK